MSSNKISIIGLGRLGLCTALVMESKGYDILGVDIFQEYCDKINNRTFTSLEPQVTDYLKAAKNLKACTSMDDALKFSDMIFILVDTPTGVGEKSYDHSKLSRVLASINDRKVENKHIIICCTVLPGYIAHTGRFLLRDCKNVTLSYNPEFIAQGTIIRDFLVPDMVLIGEGSKEVGDRLEAIYHKIVNNKPIICRMAPESAEITKLSINCFVTMKISYANMIGDIADKTPGANKIDILKAVGADSRVGTKCIMPGFGFGGPCFPRDNRALYNYAKTIGIDAMLSFSTDEYNRFHARIQVADYLKQNLDKYVFEDVCYKDKCAVPIIEESQKLAVARLIKDAGKKVVIRDRNDVIQEVMREFGSMFEYEITPKQ